MSRVLRLSDRNFDEEVFHSEIPVLVDFWASWCPPCKVMEPVLNELARGYTGRVKIGKINVDQNPINGAKYRIKGVPTFILFASGEVVEERVGAQSKSQLEAMIALVAVPHAREAARGH